MMGVNSGDGRGNITAYATVLDSDAVMQADRDFSACSLAPNPDGVLHLRRFGHERGGRFTNFNAPGFPAYNLTIDSATDMRNFDATTDQYNFGPLNHYQRPERRYSIGAMGHYEFGEHADVYSQLMFTDYESVAQTAPGGNFGDTDSINCDNPLFPVNALPLDRLRRDRDRQRRLRADVHPAPQRRGWRPTVVVCELVVPHGGGPARRDQRCLGLRRVRPIRQYVGRRVDAQLLRDQSPAECAQRRRRWRRPDLSVRDRRIGPELRSLESVRSEWHHPGPARLPSSYGSPDRTDEPGDLQRRHHRRPRYLRVQEPVGERRRAGRVR